MRPFLLTDEELADWTGYKRPSKQVEWLKGHHYPFTERADGRPRVIRSLVEGEEKIPTQEPNWKALEGKHG